VASLAAITIGVTSAGVAQAADMQLYLEDTQGFQVASAGYQDDGDDFTLWDDRADSYAPTLYLQQLVVNWQTVKSITNRNGANGNPVGFSYDVKGDGAFYRMRLCVNGRCVNSSTFTE
jgi:hypothetical protein